MKRATNFQQKSVRSKRHNRCLKHVCRWSLVLGLLIMMNSVTSSVFAAEDTTVYDQVTVYGQTSSSIFYTAPQGSAVFNARPSVENGGYQKITITQTITKNDLQGGSYSSYSLQSLRFYIPFIYSNFAYYNDNTNIFSGPQTPTSNGHYTIGDPAVTPRYILDSYGANFDVSVTQLTIDLVSVNGIDTDFSYVAAGETLQGAGTNTNPPYSTSVHPTTPVTNSVDTMVPYVDLDFSNTNSYTIVYVIEQYVPTGYLTANFLAGVATYHRYQCTYSRNINISVTKPEDYTINLGDSIDFHSSISSLYENNVATLWKGTFQYKKAGSDEWIDVDANFMDADRTETGQVYSLTPDASFDQAQVRYKYVLSRDTSVVVYSNAGTIHISPYLPVAAADTVTTAMNTKTTISVLTNDSDPNGDILTVTSTTTPAHGSVVINGDGTVSYTPAAGYVGTDTFDYTISDGKGGTATATVTVTIPNAPPSAAGDTVTTALNTPATISVLTNDSDPNGDMLTVTSTTTPAHGRVVINSDGTVSYTPAAGYAGTDTFDYTISDGKGGTATATVAVTIPNTPPTVTPAVGLSSITKTGEGTSTVIPAIIALLAFVGGTALLTYIHLKRKLS